MNKDEWAGKTGQGWAQEWRRTDRSFAMLTERLLARTREYEFSSVLDVGCGAGELSLAIARGRPKVDVVGVDISPDLIDVARERGSQLPNASFTCADASSWEPEGGFQPELLVSRHGVMFFDDPVAAFSNLSGLASTGARLMFSCFREPANSPFFTKIAGLLPPPPSPPDPYAPGPFAFADKDRVEGILQEAGWTDIAFESFDFAMVAGGGADPIDDAVSYFSRIGPAARAIDEMDDGAREQVLAQLRDLAKANLFDGIVTLRAGAWIVTAGKA